MKTCANLKFSEKSFGFGGGGRGLLTACRFWTRFAGPERITTCGKKTLPGCQNPAIDGLDLLSELPGDWAAGQMGSRDANGVDGKPDFNRIVLFQPRRGTPCTSENTYRFQGILTGF